MQLPVSFSADAARSLGGPEWLVEWRLDALERFAESPQPATDEDLWRYGRISELDLEKYVPSGTDRAPAACRAAARSRRLAGSRPPCSSASASAPVLRSSSTACP